MLASGPTLHRIPTGFLIENICLCIIMIKFSDACCIGLPCYSTKVTVTFQGIGFSNNETFLYTLYNVGQRSERLFEGNVLPKDNVIKFELVLVSQKPIEVSRP